MMRRALAPVSDRLSAELLRLIGAADFIALTETFGGRRLFLPKGTGRGELQGALSEASLAALSSEFAGSYIRVPLARDFRARHYREHGLSNAQIARKLLITETAVDKLFARMIDKPAKGGADQSDLFAA